MGAGAEPCGTSSARPIYAEIIRNPENRRETGARCDNAEAGLEFIDLASSGSWRILAVGFGALGFGAWGIRFWGFGA